MEARLFPSPAGRCQQETQVPRWSPASWSAVAPAGSVWREYASSSMLFTAGVTIESLQTCVRRPRFADGID